MLAASEPYYYLGVGYSSEVMDIQRALNSKIGANLVVDGQFGPLTKSAVESFQAKNGLVADGIVGPKTWNILIGSSSFTQDVRPNFQYENVMSPNQPVGIQTQQQYANPIGPVLPRTQPSTTWFMWVGLAGLAFVYLNNQPKKKRRRRR